MHGHVDVKIDLVPRVLWWDFVQPHTKSVQVNIGSPPPP